MTECASCCSKWIYKARLYKRTAGQGGFYWWKWWVDGKDRKPAERTEVLSMFYLPLAFAGRKAQTAPNWRVQRNPKWCFLKWAWDYIKIHRSKKQKTEICSLDLSHHKLLSSPLQYLKCFSAWSLLSQTVNSWSNNSVLQDDVYILTVSTTIIANWWCMISTWFIKHQRLFSSIEKKTWAHGTLCLGRKYVLISKESYNILVFQSRYSLNRLFC